MALNVVGPLLCLLGGENFIASRYFMEGKIGWKDRLRYWVDNTFSQGTIALIAWLAVISLLIIFVAGAILSLTGLTQDDGAQIGFLEGMWLSLMRTLDAGTMGGDTGWGFRLLMLLVTIGGIFVISTLIGILSSAIEGKLDELRKGRSQVIENNHTVILGWSEQVFTIVSEIMAANANLPSACIVILGEHDKVEMEDAIRERVDFTGKTRVVCRTGNPIEMADLKIASLNQARSIIVLSPEDEDPDAEVIKTVLAITHAPDRRSEPYHIVAELRDMKNSGVAKVVGKDEVEWVLVGDLIARVIAQTCRQSGLSVVYNEMLDFGGDEIYFTRHTDLVGKSYGEALNAYTTNAVMGIARADGSVELNPPMNYTLGEKDQLVLLAADDDQIFFSSEKLQIQENLIVAESHIQPAPERTLILGWNWRGAAILRELDNYVAPDSEVLVAAGLEAIEEEVQAFHQSLTNQRVRVLKGDTSDRVFLEQLGLKDFNHVIVLSYLDTMTEQRADSSTLITLLHLRDMADRQGLHFSLVSEMVDVRNRNLAEVARADDFIVSGKLISLMLAQISENKRLNAVFGDLFDPEGAEVYLKPVELFVTPGQPVNFYTVVEAARRQGATAIGYRVVAEMGDAARSYGVHLNPPKSATVTFQPGDKIVVLSEN